jgi:hypothetical protein
MGTVQLVVAVAGPWNTAAFMGSLAGLLVSFILARFYRGDKTQNGDLDGRGLAVALSGYAILVVITLLIQLVKVVKQLLGGVVIKFDIPELTTSPGMLRIPTTKPSHC